MSNTRKIFERLEDELFEKLYRFSHVFFNHYEIKTGIAEDCQNLGLDAEEECRKELEPEFLRSGSNNILEVCIVEIMREFMRGANKVEFLKIPCENFWEIWEEVSLWETEMFKRLNLDDISQIKLALELAKQVFEETKVFDKPVTLDKDGKKYQIWRYENKKFFIKFLSK